MPILMRIIMLNTLTPYTASQTTSDPYKISYIALHQISINKKSDKVLR